MSTPPLRIAIVYDRVYPASIGGAERFYGLLAERLAAAGHHVTYLAADHWSPQAPPSMPGVELIALSRQKHIYDANRRRILPVLAFPFAVARFLLRRDHHFDVVHTSAISPWLALVCVAAARLRRRRCVLDWWEVWTTPYWQKYLGERLGLLAALAQRVVARSPHAPVTHSRLHSQRIRKLSGHGDALLLRGVLGNPEPVDRPEPASHFVLFAGRLIPEKQVLRLIPAIARARKRMPELRLVIIGEGPDREAIATMARALHLEDAIELLEFVPEEKLRDYIRNALCVALLSAREGFGLVVAEAAAMGVPSLVLAHPDSAASELIIEEINGVICASAAPRDVAAGIARIDRAGFPLRERTLGWYRANETVLSLEASLPALLRLYRRKSQTA